MKTSKSAGCVIRTLPLPLNSSVIIGCFHNNKKSQNGPGVDLTEHDPTLQINKVIPLPKLLSDSKTTASKQLSTSQEVGYTSWLQNRGDPCVQEKSLSTLWSFFSCWEMLEMKEKHPQI